MPPSGKNVLLRLFDTANVNRLYRRRGSRGARPIEGRNGESYSFNCHTANEDRVPHLYVACPGPVISDANLAAFEGRQRRKKCNEALKPMRCERCIKSKRACVWPTPEDLIDRRNVRGSKFSKSPSPSSSIENEIREMKLAVAAPARPVPVPSPFFVCREIAFKSDLFNATTFKSDLEVNLFRRYVEDLQPLLLLPTTHPGFTAQLVPEEVDMLLRFDGLRDIILALGASHTHHRHIENAQLSEASIKYYSRAVSGVTRALHNIDWNYDDFDDALLLAVILLYIHGARSLS